MVVIACETLRAELDLAMTQTGCSHRVIWIESGLHDSTEKLRARLQQAIDSVEEGTALLAFGFCGNSVVGLNASRVRLIIPKAADCITLFMGGREKRDKMGFCTYFFTEGYLRGERNIVNEYQSAMERYDPETAEWVMREMMKHYERFAVIDTGTFDVSEAARQIACVADILRLPVETVKGDLCMFRELLTGPWPCERFLEVSPGECVSLSDSLDIGNSQI